MNYPKVSVIIPIYGVADYIATCINSVIEQDYKNLEVLLVNDCTPDDSMSIVQQIIGEYDGPIEFKIINHQVNRKLAAVRNTGIGCASGEFIFFLDGDDRLLPLSISRLVKEAVDSGSVVTTANRKAVDWNTGKTYKILEGDYPHLRVEHIDLAKGIQVHGTVWNKLIKRDFVVDNKLYFEEGIIYEDDLWMFKLYCCQPSFSSITDVTYICHVRPNSIMQTYSETHLLSRVIVAQKAIEYLPQVKKGMLAYACHAAENFRQGAFMACLAGVSGLASYNRIYKFLRKCRIDYKNYMSSEYPTVIAKLRFSGYVLPSCIGRWWNLAFVKMMLWKDKHNYPYVASGKIWSSNSFWENLQKNGTSK